LRDEVSRLGVITGLRSEAACLQGALRAKRVPCAIRITGGRSDAARRGTQALLNGGVTGMLSFGYAGGLEPGLRPGVVLIGEAIVLPDGQRLPADAAWIESIERAARQLGVATRRGAIAGSEHAVTTVAEKRWLHERSRALAVDMESHAVARAAKPRVPFIAVRVILDAHDRAVPEAAAKALRPDGRVALAGLVGGLVLRPAQIPGLLALARDSAAAKPALRRAAAVVAAAGLLG
jgi:adenosylhomocysteine nucleosidase